MLMAYLSWRQLKLKLFFIYLAFISRQLHNDDLLKKVFIFLCLYYILLQKRKEFPFEMHRAIK